MVIESEATMKEAMVAARHSTPGLTLNTYGRARIDRLAELAEKAGEAIFLESTKSAQRQELKKAAGAGNCCARTTSDTGKLVAEEGFEPTTRGL